MKFLEYSHPARTNVYSLNRAYSLDELRADGLNDDQIKILFKPVNFKWDERKTVEVKVEPEVKVEAETKVEVEPEIEAEVEIKSELPKFGKGKGKVNKSKR